MLEVWYQDLISRQHDVEFGDLQSFEARALHVLCWDLEEEFQVPLWNPRLSILSGNVRHKTRLGAPGLELSDPIIQSWLRDNYEEGATDLLYIDKIAYERDGLDSLSKTHLIS